MAAAAAQGPGLLFGLGGSGALAQAAQWLFLTSLFAAALAFHNVWRYMFALGREGVLPAALGRTGAQQHPQGRLTGPEPHRPGRHRRRSRLARLAADDGLFFWLRHHGRVRDPDPARR